MHATEIKLVYGRKHPIDPTDIIALEASLTVQAEPGESEDSVILAGFRHMATLLRQAVAAEIAEVAGQPTPTDPPPGYAPAIPPERVEGQLTAPNPQLPTPNSPPATAAEAEQRFFARYGAIVGGNNWLAVRRYMHTQAPKPATVDGWIAVAEAVRDRNRQSSAQPAS